MATFVDEMRVTKRNKSLEDISFDKILKRIKSVGKEQNLQNINYSALCLKIIDQLYDKIETTKRKFFDTTSLFKISNNIDVSSPSKCAGIYLFFLCSIIT